ncbi:MAG: acetylserotonin O-methyltransferase [Planctomycetaceae bacterium]|nr:acetylserotonin O-methyltransferase [Planctomycetaceae bacterium]
MPTIPASPTTVMQNFYAVFPSFAMVAAMQLDVFTPLKSGPMTGEQLASALGVRQEKLEPLLYALVVAGVLEEEAGNFANTEESARFLVQGEPEYIGGMGGFFSMLWSTALQTAESIRTGEPHAKHDFHTLTDEELLVYFRNQIHSSLSGGREIAAKVDLSACRSVLDAGGGSGGVSIALCEKYPDLKATVADLPKVAKLAGRFAAEAGFGDRITADPVDLTQEPPTGQFDVAVLRALIQTLSIDDARRVLKNIAQSMTPGGRIYIFGNVLHSSRLGPPSSIAFSLVFLNVYDSGAAYTEAQYRDMLESAGFAGVAVAYDVLGDGMGMVSATKA